MTERLPTRGPTTRVLVEVFFFLGRFAAAGFLVWLVIFRELDATTSVLILVATLILLALSWRAFWKFLKTPDPKE